MRIRKAIIPAAGLGTRFLPATKVQPKEMLPVVDKPAIQYVVEEAIQSGIESIIIVTGKNKRAIEDHFDKSYELEFMLEKQGKSVQLQQIRDLSKMVDIQTVRQKDPLGLGHAILCAKSFINNEPFAVLLGDDIIDSTVPALQQLVNAYEATNDITVAVQSISKQQISRYGVVESKCLSYQNAFKVKNMVEKPSILEAPSDLGIIGRYILTPEIFPILHNLKPDEKKEIQLTNAIQKLCKKDIVSAVVLEGERYDIGNVLGYLKANIELGIKRREFSSDLTKYLFSLVDNMSSDNSIINNSKNRRSI
jgi:UTP--glucose-1-phosphate uridylyltransferase